MPTTLTRDDAWALLTEYNKDPFHLEHAQIVEQTMRYFADKLGYGDEQDFWGIVGLLHDLDFEQFPDQHCIKEQEILRERGIDERIIHATASHGYGITVDIQPEHEMEKVLYATDELTGLIGAVALMRPSQSVQDLTLNPSRRSTRAKTSPPAAPGKSLSAARTCSAGLWTTSSHKPSRRYAPSAPDAPLLFMM